MAKLLPKPEETAARQHEAFDGGAVGLGYEVAHIADIFTLAIQYALPDDIFRHSAGDGRDLDDPDLRLTRSFDLNLRRCGFDPDIGFGGADVDGALALDHGLWRLLGLSLGRGWSGEAQEQGRRDEEVSVHGGCSLN